MMVPAGIGRTDYVAFCRALGLTPDERLTPMQREDALPPWLTAALIGTAAARQKLSDWARMTPAPREDALADPAELLVQLRAVGDFHVLQVLAATLAHLPPPVRDYVARRCTFVLVGLSLGGWCGPQVDFGERPWCIVVSAALRTEDRLRDLCAHEIAHAWTLPEPEPGVPLCSSLKFETVYGASAIPGHVVEIVKWRRARYEEGERQAKTLTRTWGFADV